MPRATQPDATEPDAAVDAYVSRSVAWPDEVAALRPILRSCGLTETLKWHKPCYCDAGKNIVIIQEFKAFVALMFFKGALLADPAGVLETQGPNWRSARRMCFTSVDDVMARAGVIEAYVRQAVEAERAGREVEPGPEPEWVAELSERLADDEQFRIAFEALTPGRQREYNFHFAGAARSATRSARIERNVDRILAGQGLRDR